MEKRGQVNEYVCRTCKHTRHIILLNNGTTPFGIVCKNCNDLDMFSNFYRITAKQINVTHAFYRPAKAPETREMIDWVFQGCLLLGKLEFAVHEMLHGDKTDTKMEFEEFQEYLAGVYGIKPPLVDDSKQ